MRIAWRVSMKLQLEGGSIQMMEMVRDHGDKLAVDP